ncbi:hypothetical protein MPSEU_000981500 [Mayamaea pseudoterrestris]|nr:hypothetical protein MPSEU_000981500 [Mayamaea pseudoterrestris]
MSRSTVTGQSAVMIDNLIDLTQYEESNSFAAIPSAFSVSSSTRGQPPTRAATAKAPAHGRRYISFDDDVSTRTGLTSMDYASMHDMMSNDDETTEPGRINIAAPRRANHYHSSDKSTSSAAPSVHHHRTHEQPSQKTVKPIPVRRDGQRITFSISSELDDVSKILQDDDDHLALVSAQAIKGGSSGGLRISQQVIDIDGNKNMRRYRNHEYPVDTIAATPSLEEELIVKTKKHDQHKSNSLTGDSNAIRDRSGLSPDPIEISPSLETEYIHKEQQQQLSSASVSPSSGHNIRLDYSSSPDQGPDHSSSFFRLTEQVIESRSRQQQMQDDKVNVNHLLTRNSQQVGSMPTQAGVFSNNKKALDDDLVFSSDESGDEEIRSRINRARNVSQERFARESSVSAPEPIFTSPSLETEFGAVQYNRSGDGKNNAAKYRDSPERMAQHREVEIAPSLSKTESVSRSSTTKPLRTVIDIESLKEQEGKNNLQAKSWAPDSGSVGSFESRDLVSLGSKSMYRRAIQARRDKRRYATPTRTSSLTSPSASSTIPAALDGPITDERSEAGLASPFKPIQPVDTLEEEGQDGSSFRKALREKYRKLIVSPAHSDFDSMEKISTGSTKAEENVTARFFSSAYEEDMSVDPVIGYTRSNSTAHSPSALEDAQSQSPSNRERSNSLVSVSQSTGEGKIVLQGTEVIQVDQATVAKYAVEANVDPNDTAEPSNVAYNSACTLDDESNCEPRKKIGMSKSGIERNTLLSTESEDSGMLSQEIRAAKSLPSANEFKKALKKVDPTFLKSQLEEKKVSDDSNSSGSPLTTETNSMVYTDSDDTDVKQGQHTYENYKKDLAIGESSSTSMESTTKLDHLISLKIERPVTEMNTPGASSPKSPEELYTRHHNPNGNADTDDGGTSDGGESRGTADASRATNESYDRREGATVSSNENSARASLISIMHSESSESEVGLHPDLDPHLLYDSEAMHFVISMLDKSCAWLEDDNCNNCSFQPSASLLKEIKRKQQEEASRREEIRYQTHSGARMKGKAPSLQSVKRVSDSPLVQRLHESNARRVLRNANEDVEGDAASTDAVPLSPFARPRRTKRANALSQSQDRLDPERGSLRPRSPRKTSAASPSKSPRGPKPLRSPRSPRSKLSEDEIPSSKAPFANSYYADVSDDDRNDRIPNRRSPSRQNGRGKTVLGSEEHSLSASPFQKKLQERLASVRGDAEKVPVRNDITPLTSNLEALDDEPDIRNLNSSPSDPVDLVEQSPSNSSGHDENNPALDQDAPNSLRSKQVSSEWIESSNAMWPKQTYNYENVNIDTSSIQELPDERLNKVISPETTRCQDEVDGDDYVLELEDEDAESRDGATRNMSFSKARARDPSPGRRLPFGVASPKNERNTVERRDDVEERSESPELSKLLPPSPTRQAFMDKARKRDPDATTILHSTNHRKDPSPTKVRVSSPLLLEQSSECDQRDVRSRSKIMPELSVVSSRSKNICAFQEELSTQDKPIRSTAGGPEGRRPKPIIRHLGGPLETIAETGDEDEQPQQPQFAALTPDERQAALDLAEKLRRRADTLKRRRRARRSMDDASCDDDDASRSACESADGSSISEIRMEVASLLSH